MLGPRQVRLRRADPALLDAIELGAARLRDLDGLADPEVLLVRVAFVVQIGSALQRSRVPGHDLLPRLPARDLLAALRSEGYAVDGMVEASEHGKFGWVMDPEGNRIELWEPPAGI